MSPPSRRLLSDRWDARSATRLLVMVLIAFLPIFAACGQDGEDTDGETTSTTAPSGPGTTDSTAPTDNGTSFDHPEGADEVVLRVEEGGGLVPRETVYTQVPLFSLYGDGTVIVSGPGEGSLPAAVMSELFTTQISEGAVQHILAAARDAGLLEDRDYGRPAIEDAPTTTFLLSAQGTTAQTEVYALGYESSGGEDGLDEAQREAREKLRDLRSRLLDPSSLTAEELEWEAYEYPGLHVFAFPEDRVGPTRLAWPLGNLEEMGAPVEGSIPGARHGVLSREDTDALRPLLELITPETGWVGADVTYRLVFRPLLPDEDPAASLEQGVDLPDPVSGTRADILEAAQAGDLDALAAIALEGDSDFSYSFGGAVQGGPAAYWSREMEQGSPVLADLVRILEMPWASVEDGSQSEGGLYVWPFAHAWDWSEMEEARMNTLQAYFPQEQIEEWSGFGGYAGRRVGISADGDWLFYIAGD